MSLKALLLVGGYGTRFRPLTFSKPKPLVEFLNKPIIVHQIEALKAVGVDEIILAISYKSDFMAKILGDLSSQYQIKLTSSVEDHPLGTAGPIGLAKNLLNKGTGNEIFVFNADITCKFPLKEMLEFHRKHGKEGTIGVTKIKDPSRYGLVLSDENRKIIDFIEKPTDFITNEINAGIYIFNKKFLNRVEAKPTSIEREIFPMMAKENELYSYHIEGFWKDLGKPCDYLLGTKYMLEHYKNIKPELLEKNNKNIIGNCLIDKSSKIEEDTLIGPNVVIGPNCIIKKGCRIKDSVILENSEIGEFTHIENSVIGWKNILGKWCRIDGLTITGEEVTIKDEVRLSDNIICPYIIIKKTPKEHEILMFQ